MIRITEGPDEEAELSDHDEDALERLEAELEGIDAEFFQATDFDPLPHVLSAVSAAGRHEQEQAFRALQAQKSTVDSAVARVVGAHHEGFKAGVSNFARLRKGLAASQTRLRDLRRSVADSRSMLTQTHSRELRELYFDFVQTQQMTAMLGRIERLVELPAEIDACVAQRRYVRAVALFNEAMETMFAPDLLPVEALARVRDDLMERKQQLEEAVLDQLGTHIYAHARSREFFAEYRGAVADVLSSGAADELVRLLGHDAAAESAAAASEAVGDDPEPGAPPVAFIRAAVEALARLGRLAEAANGLQERLQDDLTAVLHAQFQLLAAHGDPAATGGERLCQLIVLAAAAFAQVTHHHTVFLAEVARAQGLEPYAPDDVWDIAAFLLLQVLQPHVRQPAAAQPASKSAAAAAGAKPQPVVVMSGLFRFRRSGQDEEDEQQQQQQQQQQPDEDSRASIVGGLSSSCVVGGLDLKLCEPSPLLLLDVYVPLGRVVPAMARTAGVQPASTAALSNLLRSMFETELLPVLQMDAAALLDALARQPDLHLRDRRDDLQGAADSTGRGAWADALLESESEPDSDDDDDGRPESDDEDEEDDDEDGETGDSVPSLAAARVMQELRRLVAIRRAVPDQDDEISLLVNELLRRFTSTCAAQLAEHTGGTAAAAAGLQTDARRALQARLLHAWHRERRQAGEAEARARSRPRTASGLATMGSFDDGDPTALLRAAAEAGGGESAYREERSSNLAAFAALVQGDAPPVDAETLLRARQGLALVPALGRSCRFVARGCAQLAHALPPAMGLPRFQAELQAVVTASLQALAAEVSMHAAVFLGQLPRCPRGLPDLAELGAAVHRFNAEALATEEVVRPFLLPWQVDYLFASLARFVSWLLAHQLLGFRGHTVTAARVEQLRSAAFSLQYNMLSAVPTAPLRHWFERTRRFLQLLDLSEAELEAVLPRVVGQFDKEELELLCAVGTDVRGAVSLPLG